MPWTSWRDRPLYVQDGDRVTGRSVTAEQYGRFLIDVFEEWVRRDVGEVYVQMFDVALANWVGEPPGLCIHSETCGLALALEHTGDLYSCDHFVEPKYKLGNIRETHMLELVASQQQRQFGLDKRETLPQLLPRLRRPLRLPRRLPQGPVHRDARRRAGPQLPLRRLQGLLPPRRPADADHGRAAYAEGRAPSEIVAALRGRGCQARPQRPLHLRLRAQVEALPRRRPDGGRAIGEHRVTATERVVTMSAATTADYAMRMAAVFTLATSTILLRVGLAPRWLVASG